MQTTILESTMGYKENHAFSHNPNKLIFEDGLVSHLRGPNKQLGTHEKLSLWVGVQCNLKMSSRLSVFSTQSSSILLTRVCFLFVCALQWLGHWYMLGRIIPCGWSGARVFTDFQMFQCLIGEDVITEDTWRYLYCICIQHAVQVGMCLQRRFESVCAS